MIFSLIPLAALHRRTSPRRHHQRAQGDSIQARDWAPWTPAGAGPAPSIPAIPAFPKIVLVLPKYVSLSRVRTHPLRVLSL